MILMGKPAINLSTLLRLFFVAMAVLFSTPSARSQNFTPRINFTFGGGMIFSDFDIREGIPGFSLVGAANYQWNKNLRAGVNIGYHKAVGSDEETYDSQRGYSFRSNLFEVTGRFAYIFTFPEYPVKKWNQKFHPFLYSGAGILQVQSDLYDNSTGSRVDTGPEYITVTPVINGGAGIYFKISSLWLLSFEAGSNLAFSDFLESYSNETSASSRDMYHCLILRLVWSEPLGFGRGR